MQRYRINYRLLIGLFVGSLVLSISLHFVWKWRVSSKANWYREHSQAALDSGNTLEAFDFLGKFVKLRPDDEEARVDMASIAADVAVMDGVSSQERGIAFGVLSETVRRTGDPGLRRKLAEMQFEHGRPQDAIVHLKQLLETDPDDSELQAMYVQALFRAKDYIQAIELAFNLIGYDRQTEEFKQDSAKAADQPKVYATLANALVQEEKDEELARRVIDQMAAVNPDSAVAHLSRSVFLYSVDEKEEAADELEKAIQLDPNDTDILYRKAAVAKEEKDFENARQFVTEGIEKSPDEMRFYQLLASIELGAKSYDAAVAALDSAIKRFGEQRSLELIIFKIDILLSQGDLVAAEEAIRQLEEMENPRLQPMIDYEHARIKLQNDKWAEAAVGLEKVRPQLAAFGRTQAVAGTLLGEAYEKLGKLDLALQVYELVLDSELVSSDDPVRLLSQARADQIRKRLGIQQETVGSDFMSVVKEMAARPENEQDWQEIDDLVDKLSESRGLSEIQRYLVKAQVYAERKMLSEAKDMVREAAKLDRNDVEVQIAAAQLLLMDKPDGPANALEVLNRIERDFAPTVRTRSLKAEALMDVGGDDVQGQLRALTEGTEEWNNHERFQLMVAIGLKFLQLGEPEKALQYMNQAAGLDPSNLPLRLQMFDIAFQKRDDDAMRQAQAAILELVGNKEDGNYVLTEVKRRLIGYRGDEEGRIRLQEARRMLEDTLEKRPQWHEAHVLYGQVLLLLGEDSDLALQHFNDALKYGRPNPNAVAMLVRLLVQKGEFRQAQERIELIPVAMRGALLDRVETSVLLANGEAEDAFESAQREAERKSEDASTQAWFGEIAEQTGHPDAAAAAFRRATDLDPLSHQFWMKLVSIYAQQKDMLSIETTMREAQLALEPQYIPLIQAKMYQLLGRWKNSEDIYKNLYKGNFGNPNVAREMADFYMLWARSDRDAIEKAAPYINLLLRGANEGKLPPDDANVLWARENAARILASTGDYQDSMKAQRLLMQGSVDGKMPIEFQTLYGEILSSRSDPESLLAAIDTLSTLNQQGRLGKSQILLLANLYARTNNWKLGKALMLDALSRYGTDPEVWNTYISLLIGQGEYNTASQRINRFAEISSNQSQLFQLRARLAYERGNQAEVKRLLQALLPPKLGPTTPLDDNQLNSLRFVAALAVQYEEFELAEQLLRLYTSRKSDGLFDLLTVLALHGDADEAVTVMNKLVKEAPLKVAQLATQMLRQRRTEFGDRYDDAVSELVLSVWEEAPDVADRLVLRAEMYEVMEKYDESIRAYEEVVNRDDVPQLVRATASNNLAYLLALKNKQLDKAQELIDNAIEILGPLADILDTRAVIRMAREEYNLAVEDMILALSIDPTAVKYYHMAKAQALAGNKEKALEAWESANEMGIEQESLPLIEQPGYKETQQMIENIRS